jgi:hypothetical protein
MPPGDLGVGGVAPFDLGKASHRVAQMRKIEGTRGVVMGEAASLLAPRRLLDYRERRIRELADIGSAPRRSRRAERGDRQDDQCHGNYPRAHLISPHARNVGHVCRTHLCGTIDGLAPL